MANERVQITNHHHPHFDEYGRWTGETIVVLGQRMGRVALENCRHGASACYVKPGDISEVTPIGRFSAAQERRLRRMLHDSEARR